MDAYFMDPIGDCGDDDDEEDDSGVEEDGNKEAQKLKEEEERKQEEKEYQEEANIKYKKRQADFGDLLRSKGFLWVATSHNTIGAWQQAGSVLRITPEVRWMCLQELDAVDMGLIKADMVAPDGTEYEYKDRRQEIVFIGHKMNVDAIKNLLDSCLLTDEEFALGPEKWKEVFAEFNELNFEIQDEEEEEGDEVDEDLNESQ